jgi:type IV pilus assembly protein PilW
LGFSLIELLIAMTIGLFLVLVISLLFVNSKRTYLAQDANSRIQETARFAHELLSTQARMAGYREIRFDPVGPNLFAPVSGVTFAGTAIAGTEGASNAPDTMTFSFDSTVDCLGQAAASPAVNLFRINASRQLECLGNGGANAGVLLDGVEDMQVLYGQPVGGSFAYLPANSSTMANVTGVRVCLMLRTLADASRRATDVGQSQQYWDCQGNSQTASDGFLRRPVTMTIDLRNRLP